MPTVGSTFQNSKIASLSEILEPET